jgi:8-oxo-dGTP pyrophosphatase MutT (NUDIX family)
VRLLSADADELRSSSSRAVARAQVVSVRAVEDAVRHQRDVLAAVDADSHILVRTARPGHLTGSGLVVDAAGERFILVHHRKLQIWVQPGGHADGEASLAHVALDECTEETGIDGLRIAVPAIDVDVHRVAPPREDAHLHYDIRFLVVAPPGAELRINHESIEGRWVGWDETATVPIDAGTKRLVAAGRRAVRELADTETNKGAP